MHIPISPNSNHFFLFHLLDAFIEENIHDRFSCCKINLYMITTDTFLPSVLKKECGAKVKISFATDSPINGDQKSVFSEISKKTSNTKNVLLVFFSNFSNLNDFCLNLLFIAIKSFHFYQITL